MKDHMTRDNLNQKVAALCKERDELRRKIDQLVIRLNDETEKVTRLETECREKEQQIKDVIKERDAAVANLKSVLAGQEDINVCLYCKHREEDGQCHHLCIPYSNKWGWEWRGVQDKNNKME